MAIVSKEIRLTPQSMHLASECMEFLTNTYAYNNMCMYMYLHLTPLFTIWITSTVLYVL